ncbi:hypothetical protein GCM10027425_15020 [Alteromonas gracilis]
MTENSGDWGETELDPREQADAEINLEDPSAGDDEPWSPPDRQPRGAEDVSQENGPASIDDRVAQEVPEPDPLEEPRMIGGDDPDAIPADADVLGGPAGEDVPVEGEGPEASALRVVEDADLPE